MLALITGASSGIGEALAHEHASRGGDLIVVARREEKLLSLKDTLRELYGVKVVVIPKDLSRREAAQDLFDEVRAKKLAVEYLINNAGFGGQGAFHEREWPREEAMIEVNILTLTALTRLFLPEMVQRNSGRILNVASTAALVPAGPLQSVYFATKHFVLSFSLGIAGELLDTNVSVTTLCPGPIATEFAKTAGLDKTALFARAFTPESVAKDGYDAMLKGKLVQLSGLSLSSRLTLSVASLLPRKLLLRQIKRMQKIPE